MQYCFARLEQKQKDEAYRIYSTDALYAIAGNTAKFVGGDSMSMRFVDMISVPAQTRTADEIINDVLSLCKIEVID